MFNLGIMYRDGYCIEQDTGKARTQFMQLIGPNVPHGDSLLGDMYYSDAFGKPDYQKAYMHWSQAARGGLLNWTRLAELYYHGLNTEADPAMAESILLGSVRRGDPKARQQLLEYYRDPDSPLHALDEAATPGQK